MKDIKVLVVDDMLTMRKLVKKCLVDIGFALISEADDGESAWPLITQAIEQGQPFRLIVSDWNMPKVKGIDLLRKVRADERIKATPFVLLTAEAEQHQVVEAVNAGVSGYVTKPFTPAMLNEKLMKALGK